MTERRSREEEVEGGSVAAGGLMEASCGGMDGRAEFVECVGS